MSKKLVSKYLLLIIIACAFVSNVYAQAAWMTDNAAILGVKQLNEIALPGAHDAGTFAIAASKSTGITLGASDGFSSPDNKKNETLFVARFDIFRLGENAGTHDR